MITSTVETKEKWYQSELYNKAGNKINIFLSTGTNFVISNIGDYLHMEHNLISLLPLYLICSFTFFPLVFSLNITCYTLDWNLISLCLSVCLSLYLSLSISSFNCSFTFSFTFSLVSTLSITFYTSVFSPSMCPFGFFLYCSVSFIGLVCFYGISTLVDYLRPNPLYTYILNISDL